VADRVFDLAIIGGGINGCGIARDAAGRGLSVFLCEQGDLAGATSSASTKLIHGGLRYLEHYAFRLVREALGEREVLLRAAPHIIRPQRFVLPYHKGLRPRLLMRFGLFLYDHLGGRRLLPPTRALTLAADPAGVPLRAEYAQAFEYSDCVVDDARLVVLNAVDARIRGASINRDLRCVVAEREGRVWKLALESATDGDRFTVAAKALVNAAGPWAAQFLREHAGIAVPKALRLIKGSHIVVRKLFDHPFAYIFQNADRRIIFAIPYEGEFTLIGTTDVETQAPIGEAHIDADETRYLCEQASRYFARAVTPSDLVWSYAGVRPLLDEAGDAASVTRDYLLELDTAGAPLLNVWGGKITTFRKLAEEAAELLRAPWQITGAPWTAAAPLPGGDLSEWITPSGRPDRDIAAFDAELAHRQPQLDAALRRRWVHSYGSRVALLLAQPLGAEVAPHLHEGELHHLRDHEWARSADDVLWRRSKLGLHYSAAEREQVQRWWQRWAGDATTAPALSEAPSR